MNKMLKIMIAGLTLVAATQGFAQEQSTNRVAVKTDWNVFVDSNPTQCWVVSSPKEMLNTKEGRVVSVNRGDVLMFVSYWPGPGKLGEVSFTGGYPYPDGSAVNLTIGNNSFELFTKGETAWAASPADDDKIIASMKRGSKAVITGVSGRGTKTQDSFSLLGFTAALDEAGNRCK